MASSVGLGQLQANAYCDSPDIVLVGTKADLLDLRDVHARQARDLADRYGWGIQKCTILKEACEIRKCGWSIHPSV